MNQPNPARWLMQSRTRAVVAALVLGVLIVCGWAAISAWRGAAQPTRIAIVPPKPRPAAELAKAKAVAAEKIPLIAMGLDRQQAASAPLGITNGIPALIPAPVMGAGRLAGAAAPADSSDLDIAFHPSLKYAFVPSLISVRSIPALLSDSSRATPDPESPINANLRMETARKFVTSLCQDQQGCLWVGCEEDAPGTGGVQRFDPSAPKLHQWTQFTTKDGLGDNNGYAVACDRKGRIWVGHLNHGVSVYNGEKWQNYEVVGGLSRPDTLSGPLGERVFSIAVSPTDGDIWIGTNRGISHYSGANDRWSFFTRVQGLSSDNITAIAIDSEGTVYCGTECQGINIASQGDQYRQWREIRAPETLPNRGTGTGLPCGEINQLLVTDEGAIVAATTAGIAWSADKGKNWAFRRGENWATRSGKHDSNASVRGCVAEDYIASLAGHTLRALVVGYRRKNAETVDISTGIRRGLSSPSAFVTAIAEEKDAAPIIGSYGSGVRYPQQPLPVAPGGLRARANFPRSAEIAATELGQLLRQFDGSKSAAQPAFVLDDDWLTQGDEIGRYGREYAVLCGMKAPYNDVMYVYTGREYSTISAKIGPSMPRDAIRTWISRLRTDDPRALYAPREGCRRQAEYDDHGEAYPVDQPGPDIWLTVALTSGIHRLSLYFVNNDGHSGLNGCRDYAIEIKRYNSDIKIAEQSPPLAKSRVSQF